MGLFDIFKKHKTHKEFEEVVVDTENVPQELLKVSKEYNLPLSSLDFKLLGVETYLKLGETDFIHADAEALKMIENENFLIDEHNEIKQVYKIKIIKFTSSELELNGQIKPNEFLTEVKFLFDANNCNINDFEKMLEELNKKKLKNNLLINLCDKQLRDDIERFLSMSALAKKENRIEITLCKCLDVIKTIQGRVDYLYKKFKKEEENLYIYPVKKNDVLIKITKPKEGRNGRNCRGEVILAEKLKEFEIPEIEFDRDSIKKVEDEEFILYVAIRDGYVVVDDGKYAIKDQLEVRQVNIKTGNIKGADESDVKMKIKESDSLKEAVADGMVVESAELQIKGNIGNKAKVKAKELTIEGQTHQNSKILAINAHINVHKGYLKAKNVTINSLENGLVIADTVHIKRALGGEVRAKEIIIDTLLSHTKVYGLTLIKIEKLKGEENLFCISPKKVLKTLDVKELEKELEEVRQNINLVKKQKNKLLEVINQNKKAYMELKKIYSENKKKGVKTSHSVLMKLKKYQELNKKAAAYNEKIENLKLKEEEILQTIDNIQNALYNAKIVNCSAWSPYNRIEFELIEPPVTLKYDTQGESACGFKLKFTEIPEIVKIKVDDDCGTEGEDI